MRKIFSLTAAFLLLISSSLGVLSVYGAESIPVLKSISFTNSAIEGEFSPDVYDYTLKLDDTSETPALESYDIDGDGELFVTYDYDENGTQTAVVANLSYENGSTIYTFKYANFAEVPLSSNNYLTDIYCTYGEISPAVNKEETDYTLYIPYDLTELTITPVTADTNATCPDLTLTLSEEQSSMVLVLTCTASDGSEREYNLKIEKVDKNTEQVKDEMAQSDYVTFVEKKRAYENPIVLFALLCVAVGLLAVILLYRLTSKMVANPYDKNEKPFYKE